MTWDEQDRQASKTRAAAAATRAGQARNRAAELRVLQDRLGAGEPLTDDDLVTAQEAVITEDLRNQEAQERDRVAHRRAAEVHRQAARRLEDLGNTAGGEAHRRAAANDDDIQPRP